jgi:hypothetical protein
MSPFALLFFSLRYVVDKHNLLYRCRLQPDGLLNRTFCRSVISVHFFCLAVCQVGLILFLISKSGGVTSVGFSVVLFLITCCIYCYLVLFVWGRRSGTSHWEEEGEDEKMLGDTVNKVEYIHPTLEVYENLQQQQQSSTFGSV